MVSGYHMGQCWYGLCLCYKLEWATSLYLKVIQPKLLYSFIKKKVSKKKIQPSYDLAILLPDGHKRTESRILKRGLHTQIHSNIIYNRQDVGAKQVSIIRWINKQNMAYTYKGILFGLKKERNSDIHHNMDEPRKHLAKWNKTITNRQLLRTPFTQGMWNSHIRRSRK